MNDFAVWMTTYAASFNPATFDGHPAQVATVNISKYPINSVILKYSGITSCFSHHLGFCPKQFPSSRFPRFPPAHGPTLEVDPKTSDAPSHRYVPPAFALNSALTRGTTQTARALRMNWTIKLDRDNMVWLLDGKTCNLGDWKRWAIRGKLREGHGWGLIFVCNWVQKLC